MNMQNYHALLTEILRDGSRQANRTGIDAISIPGAMLKFDLRKGFPAITTKKLAFKAVKGELLGFFRGYDSAAQFRELGCGVWDQNANETPAWLNSPARKGHDDLGRIYGCQWTDWKDTRIVDDLRYGEDVPALVGAGYEYLGEGVYQPEVGVQRKRHILQRGINQLEVALHTLLTNPTSRRIIVSAWRPDEFDSMALPPCHVSYQFLANVERGELSLCMYQRSADSFLGVPFNIASSALFLEVMARLSGFKPATFTHFLADAHVYVNHVEQVQEQLARTHFPAPRLVLSERVRTVTPHEVRGAFKRIQPDDISLEGYQSHAAIKAEMAA